MSLGSKNYYTPLRAKEDVKTVCIFSEGDLFTKDTIQWAHLKL